MLPWRRTSSASTLRSMDKQPRGGHHHRAAAPGGPTETTGPTQTDSGTRGATPIRVFLLDDHEVVRRGLYDLLDNEPDLNVVGEAGSAREALARAPAARPHVAVLDVRLGTPGHGGIEVCRELRARMPELACLMLTSFDDDEALFGAILAGASGYVLKQIRGSDLVSAIRAVASGQSLLDADATARVMARLRAPAHTNGGTDANARSVPGGGRTDVPPELADLTPREREVLELIGEGLTNRQIAERLFLAEKTVKNRISAVLAKLGVGRRVQAAVLVERSRERGET